MKIKAEWEVLLKQYGEALDRAQSWMILSWEKEGKQKEWYMSNFAKYKLRCKELADKLSKLAKEGIIEHE